MVANEGEDIRTSPQLQAHSRCRALSLRRRPQHLYYHHQHLSHPLPPLPPPAPPQPHQPAKMASITRLNLAPTVRTFASGVPAARGVKLNLPVAGDSHAAGPRTDRPAKFADFSKAGVSHQRLNGEPAEIPMSIY